MRLYRITSPAYASDLHGTGCMYTGGRWHYKGTRILYTSEHISLAKLEILANSSAIPRNQVLVTIEIPEGAVIRELAVEDLPDNWWHFPYPGALAQLTESWVDEKQHWVIKVPSAQSVTEYNYLLNPLHPDHVSAKVTNIEDIRFDKRLK